MVRPEPSTPSGCRDPQSTLGHHGYQGGADTCLLKQKQPPTTGIALPPPNCFSAKNCKAVSTESCFMGVTTQNKPLETQFTLSLCDNTGCCVYKAWYPTGFSTTRAGRGLWKPHWGRSFFSVSSCCFAKSLLPDLWFYLDWLGKTGKPEKGKRQIGNTGDRLSFLPNSIWKLLSAFSFNLVVHITQSFSIIANEAKNLWKDETKR